MKNKPALTFAITGVALTPFIGLTLWRKHNSRW
jgi:hypothetical protein